MFSVVSVIAFFSIFQRVNRHTFSISMCAVYNLTRRCCCNVNKLWNFFLFNSVRKKYTKKNVLNGCANDFCTSQISVSLTVAFSYEFFVNMILNSIHGNIFVVFPTVQIYSFHWNALMKFPISVDFPRNTYSCIKSTTETKSYSFKYTEREKKKQTNHWNWIEYMDLNTCKAQEDDSD